MPHDNHHKFLQFYRQIFHKLRPRFSFHYVAYTIMFSIVIFSVVQLVQATTPNPGHPWVEVGDGTFIVTGPTTVRTYTYPDANATVLTTNDTVTIAQGGTGQTTANDAFNALAPDQTGNAGKYLVSDGTNTSWATVSQGVTSVFGRTGAVVATVGDYDTSLIPENLNLYFTDERAQDAIGAMISSEFIYTDGTPLLSVNSIASTKITGTKTSAYISDFATAVQTTGNGVYVQLTGSYANPTWITSLAAAKITGLATVATSGSYADLSNTPDLSDYIELTSLSATSPLSYNNSTGTFSIPEADGSTDGYLSATDWNTFNGKQNALGYTPANVDGSNATGTWPVSITGNAVTVTNGVYTTGSYSNPTWITALAYAKLTGAPTTVSSFTNDAGYITNISSFTTTNLTEGSNLYFTDERAQDALGAMLSAEFTYADATPLLSINSVASTKITGTKTSVYISDFTTAAQTALSGLYEVPLTFSTGITRTSNTITNDLSTGVSGGQSVIGGIASGDNLTLSSTSNGTKGKILFGTSAYDEVNNRLGIGTVSVTSGNALEVNGNIALSTGGTRTISMGTNTNSYGLIITTDTTTTSGNQVGAPITLTSGKSQGSGAGGALNLNGGVGVNNSSTGGAVNLTGGNGGTTGGALNLLGGNNVGSGTGNGGAVNITAGSGTYNSSSNGGNVVINGGASTSGTVGHVVLANTRGNVGIGTASPVVKLDISYTNTAAYSTSAYNVAANRYFNIHNSGGSGQYTGIVMQVSGDNAATNAVAQIVTLQEAAASNASSIAFQTRTSAGVYTEAMRMNSVGNVGIGTTSIATTDRLSIVGDNSSRVSLLLQNTNTAGNASMYLQNNRGGFASYGGWLMGGATDAGGTLFGLSRADKLFVFTDGASTLGMGIGTLTATPLTLGTNNTAVMTLLSNGKVGIGTTTPSGFLGVTGTKIATGGGESLSSFSGSITGSATTTQFVYGTLINPTVVAGANNQVLSALTIAPTFNTNSKTGVATQGLEMLETGSFLNRIGWTSGGVAQLGWMGMSLSSGEWSLRGVNNNMTYFSFYPNGSHAMTLGSTQLMGVGVVEGSISAKIHAVRTAEQLRLGYDLSNYLSFTTGSTGATTITPTGSGKKIAFTFGTMVDNVQSLDITGTFPAVSTTNNFAIRSVFTTAGSSANNQYGQYLQMAAGHTGSGSAFGSFYDVNVAGTANGLNLAVSSGLPQGNGGFVARSFGVTATGTNFGIGVMAQGGLLNVGTISTATNDKASATNMGVLGIAYNGGASGVQVGGYFGLHNSGTPTFTSAALIADNGATTSPIFLARDNGSVTFSIIDGGSVGVGTSTFDGTNPEKFLVNAGTTTSVNAIAAKGTINNYLQLNIQNQSTGTSASSDVVATADNGSETTNYIDMGINGSGYTGSQFGGANNAYLYNLGQNLLIGTGTAAKSLIFMTGGTDQTTNERMRIDGSGNVGIGGAPSYRLDIVGDAADTTVMRISTTSGNACTFSTSTGLFSCASDARLKHDINPILNTDALSKLSALNPVTFRYNWQTSTDAPIPGFIAQEFEQIFPDMVITDPVTGYKSLSYGTLVPYTVKAIQQMNLTLQGLPTFEEPSITQRLSDFLRGIAEQGMAVVDHIKSKKVETEQLCIGDSSDQVCVTKDQLKAMLQNTANQNASQNNNGENQNTPEDNSNNETASSSNSGESPVSDSETPSTQNDGSGENSSSTEIPVAQQ